MCLGVCVCACVRARAFVLQLTTRASMVPPQPWDWELKVHPRGFSASSDEFRCVLSSNVILDQTRAVEYLLSIVDDKKVLRSASGKKCFSKTRYRLWVPRRRPSSSAHVLPSLRHRYSPSASSILAVDDARHIPRCRYTADLETEKRIVLEEILADNSPLIVNNCLYLQLTLKPVE
jgi:hypothetical protein